MNKDITETYKKEDLVIFTDETSSFGKERPPQLGTISSLRVGKYYYYIISQEFVYCCSMLNITRLELNSEEKNLLTKPK